MATPTTLPAAFVAGNVLEASQLNAVRGAFRVLQIVSTAKTDTFSTSSTTFVDVTGLTATIPPSATSSKVLVIVNAEISMDDVANCVAYIKLNGGNSSAYVGDTAGSRIRTVASAAAYVGSTLAPQMNERSIMYLDSPSTTSATTYAVQMRTTNNNAYLNRSGQDTDNANFGRGASSITVMEISA